MIRRSGRISFNLQIDIMSLRGNSLLKRVSHQQFKVLNKIKSHSCSLLLRENLSFIKGWKKPKKSFSKINRSKNHQTKSIRTKMSTSFMILEKEALIVIMGYLLMKSFRLSKRLSRMIDSSEVRSRVIDLN